MKRKVDLLIVGAGFAGIYMLHKARQSGIDAVVVEKGPEVGGTWFWNRYPGARCDTQSVAYSYSFSEELQQEWSWSERYAAQPEILAYINHVVDRFALRDGIELNTPVRALEWDEDAAEWTARVGADSTIRARFCVMATGALSVPGVVQPVQDVLSFSSMS